MIKQLKKFLTRWKVKVEQESDKYIPSDLDEAVHYIISKMNEDDKERYAAQSDQHPGIAFHFTGGMAMRNSWGLWFHESPLAKWFLKHGVYHGDDRSACVYKALWCCLNDKQFDIKKEAQYYADYWKKVGIMYDPETGETIEMKSKPTAFVCNGNKVEMVKWK